MQFLNLVPGTTVYPCSILCWRVRSLRKWITMQWNSHRCEGFRYFAVTPKLPGVIVHDSCSGERIQSAVVNSNKRFFYTTVMRVKVFWSRNKRLPWGHWLRSISEVGLWESKALLWGLNFQDKKTWSTWSVEKLAVGNLTWTSENACHGPGWAALYLFPLGRCWARSFSQS